MWWFSFPNNFIWLNERIFFRYSTVNESFLVHFIFTDIFYFLAPIKHLRKKTKKIIGDWTSSVHLLPPFWSASLETTRSDTTRPEFPRWQDRYVGTVGEYRSPNQDFYPHSTSHNTHTYTYTLVRTRENPGSPRPQRCQLRRFPWKIINQVNLKNLRKNWSLW